MCRKDPGASQGTSGGPNGNGEAGTGDGGGSSGDATTCSGDTIEACGASCTKCTAPAGGTVACVNGTCEKTCGAQTLCGDTCVDTTTSAEHCGRCDHSCGAGQCSAGACQPFPVATGFAEIHAIAMSPSGIVISADSDLSLCADPKGCAAATSLTTIKAGVSQLNDVTVAGSDVFFDGNEGDYEVVYRCPVAGCPGSGPLTIDEVVNDAIGRVIAGPNTVLWTRYQSYYGPYSNRCNSLQDCTTKPAVRPQAGSGPYGNAPTRELTVPSKIVSVGAVSTLWATGGLYNDNGKQLRACPLASTCTTPVEIDTGANGVTALTYYDGKHYGASGATGGGSVIFSVSDASPGGRALLVGDAAGITDIAVDASGIYWVNGTTGKVLRCATLTGCAGAGETLATGQTGAKRIRLDDKFVYWSTATAVMKVAK